MKQNSPSQKKTNKNVSKAVKPSQLPNQVQAELDTQLKKSKAKKNKHIPQNLVEKLSSISVTKGTAFEIVTKARNVKDRFCGSDFLDYAISDFIELHGDRAYGDDHAVTCGIGWLEDMAVTIVVLQKGKTTDERMDRNFGSAHPEGYRKALRVMQQAEKFNRPIICFVDTSGAYCGIGAEERGQGHAIAQNIMQMMTLKTPILSIVTGEGGSGGALALAIADEVWMLENAIYSVISPEGCASILFKDASKAAQAASALKLTAVDLANFGIIDDIILEDNDMLSNLKTQIIQKLKTLKALDNHTLLKGRYNRFRQIGDFQEI